MGASQVFYLNCEETNHINNKKQFKDLVLDHNSK